MRRERDEGGRRRKKMEEGSIRYDGSGPEPIKMPPPPKDRLVEQKEPRQDSNSKYWGSTV